MHTKTSQSSQYGGKALGGPSEVETINSRPQLLVASGSGNLFQVVGVSDLIFTCSSAE